MVTSVPMEKENSMYSRDPRVDEKQLRLDKRSGKKWWWAIAIHLICLLWLAPIITLLYLNFTQHIIGPAIWCPLGKCSIYDQGGDFSVRKANDNDRRDHNSNGALLFASKGLEVWFTFVAGLLVYEAQKVLCKSHGGVPEPYPLTHLEFADLVNLLNISKWTRPIKEAKKLPERQRQVSRLYAFVFLACIMALLVNLMGPATGVLVLPTVQSIDQPQNYNASERFVQMESYNPPAATKGSGLIGCDAEALNKHLYSCAQSVRGPELDSMTSFVAATSRNRPRTSNEIDSFIPVESQEDDVQFLVLNSTSHGKKNGGYSFTNFTVPNRQTLRMVSTDVSRIVDKSHLIENSIAVSSQRNGPAILVARLNANVGDITSFSLGNNKSVTCLQGWQTVTADDTEYTKCIRNGTGWNSINSQAGFSVGNLSKPNAADNKLDVQVYFSDKATYYGSGLQRDAHEVACLRGNLSTPCDWDSIFSPAKVNGSDFNGIFSNETIVEWFLPGLGSKSRIWFEFVSHLQFAVYSVDLSVGNEMRLVRLRGVKQEADQLVINPLWMLAAWSVDINGTVDAARFPTLLPGGSDFTSDINATSETVFEFSSLNIFAIAQTMSLISFESVALDESSNFDRYGRNVSSPWATRRLWAWGLGTRTSSLGVVVVGIGMVMVVFRVLFAVCFRPSDDAVQLAVSS